MRISKKILAIALSILMAVSMMPFTVFADSYTVTTEPYAKEISIWGDSAEEWDYTFETALEDSDALDNCRWVIEEDIEVTEPIVIPAGANVQIDLNGHSISGNIADTDGKKLFQVSGTLEFVGTRGGCIYNTNTTGQGHAACQALTGGTVIVSAPITFGDSDEIRNNANNTNRGCGIQNNGGTLIINDGYYTAIDANYSTGAWAYAILNVEGDTTINNATVYGNALHGALGCEGGTLTVNDGTFAVNGADNYYCLYADGDGVITVNDGTFTSNGKYALVYTAANSTVNIEDGDFTYSAPFKTSKNANVGTVEVFGGTFSNTVPAAYLADGAEQDATTGEVTVTVLPTVTANDITAEGYDTAYNYTYANDGDAKYANYYGDITVSFDRAIEAGDVVLVGAYDNFNSGNWNVVNTGALDANEEFRIVKDGLVGSPVKFSKLIAITGGDFRCAAKGVDVEGVTMTVKFNLYESATSTDPIEIESATKTYTFPETNYVAEVNGVKYETFEEALAAISTVTTATHSKAADPTYQYKTYVANGTIKLLANTTSNGVIIGSGSDLTIDFNGKTLDINAKPVGSNGTESAAMQLLKDSDITFKNGTLTSTYTYASTDTEYIQRLIQNYANLTLDNMTVGMKGNFMNQLMMSNSNGDITITDSTVSAPDFTWLGYTDAQAAESLGARAMSVGTFSTYTGVDVTVTDSTINGYVNIDNTGANGTAALTLDGSDVNGNIVDKSMNNSTVTNNGSTVDGIPAGYEWNASSVLAPIEDAFNLTVEDTIHMNLYVNADAYDADEITVTYSDPDKQNGGTKTETFAVSDLEQDAKGRYAVKILAAPAQMRDTVTVTAGSHTYTTTVAAYCEALIAQSNNAELVALAKAMLDYGKACSDEFNYNESAFASQAYNNTDDVTSALDTAAFVDTSSANNQFTSYAYIAKSVPALRIYLNTTEAEAAALGGNAFVNGEATQIMVDPNGNVCVDITGIRAEDLDKEFTVEFNGGSIRINALQFAKAKGGDLGRSMYNYYTAADAYFV